MLRSNSKSLGNHVHSSRILYIDVGIEATACAQSDDTIRHYIAVNKTESTSISAVFLSSLTSQ